MNLKKKKKNLQEEKVDLNKDLKDKYIINLKVKKMQKIGKIFILKVRF